MDQEATDSPSRSRSASPIPGAVRQRASPVKSLPPVISVTPECMPLRHDQTTNRAKPQRAIISYNTSNTAEGNKSPSKATKDTRESVFVPIRTSPRSPNLSSSNVTQFIAFPTSQIPSEFFSLTHHPSSSAPHLVINDNQHNHHRSVESETNVSETTLQLLRALKIVSTRTLRNFIDSAVSRFGGSEDSSKVRQVEVALCALLILVAGLIIVAICTPRTVTHHHHWDYFNPPQ